MHKRFVLNVISRFILAISFTMLIPLVWALYDDPQSREVFAFSVTILSGMAFSLTCLLLFKMKKKDYGRLSTRDGLAIVGLSWVVISAYGACPFYLSNTVSSYTDAFFEVVSGFTTTGASIYSDVEILPRGILFWRSLTQWLGGIGIIVLYIALLPALGSSTYHLYKAESSGLNIERMEPQLKETAKNLWMIYFVISFVILALLLLGRMPIFDALCHTFAAIATGGFSTKNASIGAYGVYIQWVIIAGMVVGGANFMLHYQAFKGELKAYLRNEELRFYIFFIVLMIFVFYVILQIAGAPNSSFQETAFQVATILTTTGFMTADYDPWPEILRYGLLIFMFMGACGGSTSGGLKIMRVLLIVKTGTQSLVQAVFPNAVIPVKFNNKPLPDKFVSSVLIYSSIFIFLFMISSGLLLITEKTDIVTAMSASVSMLSSIGPGLGAVGPIKNYGWLSAPGKWILTFLMLAGRLEMYALLVLFFPSTWRK